MFDCSDFPGRPAPARAACLGLVLLVLAACSPGLNWRQVQTETGQLFMLLPCKPDRAQKAVPLAGKPTVLSMVGCEAEGATFALSVVDIGDASQAGTVLAQWQTLTLGHMRAGPPVASPIQVAGASSVPAPVRVVAQGQQADDTKVEGQAVYFARGSQLFQAVVYAPRMPPEAADTFFASLKLQ